MKLLAALAFLLLLSPPALAATLQEAAQDFAAKNFAGARAIAEPLAQGGDLQAMAMLGQIYREGLGVGKNLDQAMTWFAKAAKAGDAPSALALGLIYLDGSLGATDYTRGESLVRQAAEAGNAQAQVTMGQLNAGAFNNPP